MNTLVELNKANVAVTTSLKVAEKFDRRHDNVLQSIQTIQTTLESMGEPLLSFQGVEIIGKNALGGPTKQKHYIMDRDAFSMLVFGFNGGKAMVFKRDYIKAFNAMETKLLRENADLLDLTGDPATILRKFADALGTKTTATAPITPDPEPEEEENCDPMTLRAGFDSIGLRPVKMAQWLIAHGYIDVVITYPVGRRLKKKNHPSKKGYESGYLAKAYLNGQFQIVVTKEGRDHWALRKTRRSLPFEVLK